MDDLELRIEEGVQYRTMDAVSLVKAYVYETIKGPSPDGILRYMARLGVIKDNLVFQPDEDRLKADVWLITEKQDAEDFEDFEKALVVKECQKDLEDRLHTLKNLPLYIILEEFFESEKISHDYLSRVFEKSVLVNLKVNGMEPIELNYPLLQVAVFAGLIKSEKEDVRERFEKC